MHEYILAIYLFVYRINPVQLCTMHIRPVLWPACRSATPPCITKSNSINEIKKNIKKKEHLEEIIISLDFVAKFIFFLVFILYSALLQSYQICSIIEIDHMWFANVCSYHTKINFFQKAYGQWNYDRRRMQSDGIFFRKNWFFSDKKS
jgi:hypothetical protein